MSDRFVIEADRRVVGIGVRFPGGFRFFASDPDFSSLESKTFPRARAISQRVARLARRLAGARLARKPAAPASGRQAEGE